MGNLLRKDERVTWHLKSGIVALRIVGNGEILGPVSGIYYVIGGKYVRWKMTECSA